MANLGVVQGNCSAENVVHSRVGDCDVEPGLITGLIAVPRNKRFSSDIETFQEELAAAVLAGQAIPIFGIEGATASGGDLQTGATDYGTNQSFGVNPWTIAYRILPGGVCLERALGDLDKKSMRFIWVEASGRIWLATTKTSAGVVQLMGFEGTAMTYNALPQNATTPFMKYFNVSYTANHRAEWLDGSTFVLDSIPEGLMGVTLVAGTAAGTARIVGACGGEDQGAIMAQMAGATADLKTAFVNDAGVNPTSANIDPETGLVTIAPAGAYRVASAVVLDGLNIVGYDGLPQTVQIEAAA